MSEVGTLDLYVRAADVPNRYRVAVNDPDGSSHNIDFVISSDLNKNISKLHARGPYRVLKDIPSQYEVSSFIGETLYRTFIMGESHDGNVSNAFDQFFQSGQGPQRLALHLPRSLYFLPWEVLRRPADPKWAFFSRFHSVVRVDAEANGADFRDKRSLPTESILQILFVLASPDDAPVGDFEPTNTGKVKFRAVRPRPTYTKFQTFISKKGVEKLNGFIFVGHGDIGADNFGRLWFVRQDGLIVRNWPSDPRPGYIVSADLNHAYKLRLGCLLACDTAWVSDELPFENSVVGAILQGTEIPFVLGTQTPISNYAARVFLEGIVEGLKEKPDLDLAVTRGRNQLYSSEMNVRSQLLGKPKVDDAFAALDWWVPVLYSKSTFFEVIMEPPEIAIPASTRPF
jgi:hypothetical protein